MEEPTLPLDKPVVMQARIDWREVWEEFKRQHGGTPLLFKGKLIFGDGWSHSATDYKGPEWPPPEDTHQLRRILLWYWGRRKTIVSHEIHILESQLGNLKDLAERRPSLAWLKAYRRNFESAGPDAKQWVPQSGYEYMKWLEERIQWLQEDLKQCLQKIEESSLAETKVEA